MQLGIIGLPMVGKTTVFELLTENSPNSTGKANLAMAKIPDPRIDNLSRVYNPRKTIYAQMELVDIPGLAPGNEKGSRGFLDAVRKADALLHVVKVFDDPYNTSEINPMNDIELVAYELLLADLDLIEKRIERINANKKKNQMQNELDLLAKLKEALVNEKPLSSVEISEAEKEILNTYQFLTAKPLLICLNLNEEAIKDLNYQQKQEIKEYAEQHDIPVVEISAAIEKEMAELDESEREEFFADLGITETGLIKIAHSMYLRLGLISFFTVGEDEVRAWTINDGDTARQAAGKIHSDIERGFIRAEVVAYEDFIQLGSMNAVKEKGLFRLEGKEYIVKDGDIVHFRFNI